MIDLFSNEPVLSELDTRHSISNIRNYIMHTKVTLSL